MIGKYFDRKHFIHVSIRDGNDEDAVELQNSIFTSETKNTKAVK